MAGGARRCEHGCELDGLDFMAGGVVRDMFRRSAWSAAVSFGLAQDHRN